MASPSSAWPDASPSKEKDNFVRLSTLLIDGGTRLLREIFSHIQAPASLADVLAKPKTKTELKKPLSKSEQVKLYPSAGGPVEVQDLDITIVFKLLRHLCNLSPPVSGSWDRLPDPAHTGQGDDLARIKYYRNETYAHVKEMKLDETQFDQLWEEISSPMIRLAKNIGKPKEKEWKERIEQYRSGPLTSTEQVCVEELKVWYEQDKDLKEGFENLKADIGEVKEDIGEVKKAAAESSQHQQQVMEEFKGLKELVLSAMGTVGRTNYTNQLMTQRLEDFKHDVQPEFLLRHISCLTADDKERIRTDEREHGIDRANSTLVECLKSQQKGFVQFVRALKESGNGHVALLLDPKGKIHSNDEENEQEIEDRKWLTIIGTAIDVRFCGTFYDKVTEEKIHSDLEAEVTEKYADPSSTQTTQLRKRLENILPRDVAFVRTEKGSLVCVLRISSVSSAEKLWEMYDMGSFETKMQESLLFDCTFETKFEAKDIVYKVRFSTERYKRIHTQLKAFEQEEEESEDPPKFISKVLMAGPGETSGVRESTFTFNIPKVFLNENELGALELDLRNYQKELAEAALQGKNTIVCAPTNSGKTYVAVHIAKEHLNSAFKRTREEAASEGIAHTRRPKVVFIVNTVNLVSQQMERFQIFLSNQYAVTDISGAKANDVPLKYLLQENDVVVMTAQILVNALKDKENRVSLGDISLLVFDECHHAQKEHPYNRVMEQYLALMLQPGKQHKLPQVVGLTASLGVGNTDSIIKAEEHILQVCANLDAECVSTVHDNKEELSKFANMPNRKVFIVSKNKRDIFEDVINQVMAAIEKDMGPVIPPPPRNRSSQAYRQWLEELFKTAATEGDRYLVTYVEQLREYHVALDINSTLRMKDAMKNLEKYFSRLDEEKFTAVDRRLKKHYSGAKKTLEEYVETQGEPQNPNLTKLKGLIVGFESDTSEVEETQTMSKGIVFTTTRESTHALLDWIEETEDLKAILRPGIIVGGGDGESGMTRYEQDESIKRFKNGDVNILLATNVAEEGLDISDCDYVIRYNVMGNEISSVQSRGRVRAKKGGRFLILAKAESGVMKRETLNKYRELLMAEAVDRVQKMDLEDFNNKVKQLQKKAFHDRYYKTKGREMRQLEFQPGDVTFLCRKCSVRACQAHHLRSIREYRVILPGKVQEKVTFKPHPKRGKKIDDVEYIEKVHCGECDQDWGVKVVIDEREWVSIKVRSFVLQYSDGSRHMHKQWKDVRFQMSELQLEDMENEDVAEDEN